MNDKGLTKVLEEFNEDGRQAYDDHWSIRAGAYDLLWELWYDEKHILDCMNGNDLQFNNVVSAAEQYRIAEEIIKVYGEHTVDGYPFLKINENKNVDYFDAQEFLKVSDSMALDSGQIVACLRLSNGKEATIDVCGEVNVTFNGVDYKTPSRFPEELKELIKTNPKWDWDERVYVGNNNWFAVRYTGHEQEDEVVEVRLTTEKEVYNYLAEMIEYYEGVNLVPSYDTYKNVKNKSKEMIER